MTARSASLPLPVPSFRDRPVPVVQAMTLGTTVAAENAFTGVAPLAGVAAIGSKSDHTHGTPLPRHPQTGFPYVDFGSTPGLVQLGRRSADHFPALLGTQDLTIFERTFLTSPVRSNGSGRATMDLFGMTDGKAQVDLYNDLDTAGAYSDPGTGNPNMPFLFGITGTMAFRSIADTPAVSTAGTASLYYKSSTNKMQISENGGAYVDLVGVGVSPGAAGSFLVTNAAGTAATWAATTEIYFDDANNRIGIGATSPQERLSVRDGTAGIIATFFGPIGLNEINVGNDKTTANSLRIGYSDTDNYGFMQVTGAAAGGLLVKSDGSIGIGALPDNAKLSFGAYFGGAAIHLYDGGAGVRYGMGIQGNELQSFIPSGAAVHWSWNIGGDLQASGTNELMRLTGAGDLGIGVTPTAKLHLNNGNLLVGNTATNDAYVQIGKSAGLGGAPGVFGGNGLGWTLHALTNTGVLSHYGASVGLTYQCLWLAGPTEVSGNGRFMLQTLNFGVNTEARMFNDLRTNGVYANGDSTLERTVNNYRPFTLHVYGIVHSEGATLTDGGNLVLGGTVGTKIGTSTAEKIGFWNATPVVRQARPTDAASIITLLTTIGLCA